MKAIERICLCTGAVLLLIVGAVWLDGAAHSRNSIEAFRVAQLQMAVQNDTAARPEKPEAALEASPPRDTGSTLAILRIPSTGIEVPVLDSIRSTALNRGVGHIDGTSTPDGVGNIGIAGHRDSFFRPLKDIEVGAEIEIETFGAVRSFRVTELSIVDPLDVSVLDAREDTMLTLVTCYPFYYVGPAPDRFIVHATLVSESRIPPANEPIPPHQ